MPVYRVKEPCIKCGEAVPPFSGLLFCDSCRRFSADRSLPGCVPVPAWALVGPVVALSTALLLALALLST